MIEKTGYNSNILGNSRFEAHMEVHVGSIDEEDDEQGIAHMIEHVAFLGSKKRVRNFLEQEQGLMLTRTFITQCFIFIPRLAQRFVTLFGGTSRRSMKSHFSMATWHGILLRSFNKYFSSLRITELPVDGSKIKGEMCWYPLFEVQLYE